MSNLWENKQKLHEHDKKFTTTRKTTNTDNFNKPSQGELSSSPSTQNSKNP